MANEAVPVETPVTRLVHGSQAPVFSRVPELAGKPLPQGGKITTLGDTAAAAHGRTTRPPAPKPDLQALVAQLNKHLNDSGRPNQFRLDPAAGSKVIQEVNPANGAVVGEFEATEFPTLANSLGIVGLLVDSRA